MHSHAVWASIKEESSSMYKGLPLDISLRKGAIAGQKLSTGAFVSKQNFERSLLLTVTYYGTFCSKKTLNRNFRFGRVPL